MAENNFKIRQVKIEFRLIKNVNNNKLVVIKVSNLYTIRDEFSLFLFSLSTAKKYIFVKPKTASSSIIYMTHPFKNFNM